MKLELDLTGKIFNVLVTDTAFEMHEVTVSGAPTDVIIKLDPEMLAAITKAYRQGSSANDPKSLVTELLTHARIFQDLHPSLKGFFDQAEDWAKD